MNSPTNELAMKLNGASDGIAGLSDIFILRNFMSIRSSDGLHRGLLEKVEIPKFLQTNWPICPDIPKVWG